MATIQTISVDPGNERIVQGPLVRVSLDGGCDLMGCACSPEPFITISDGTHLFNVTLTMDEVESIRNTGWIDTSQGVFTAVSV